MGEVITWPFSLNRRICQLTSHALDRKDRFHTDRGCQFTSADFRNEIDELGMVQSFSTKGHPYDNAVMECFFKYLKKEELNRRSFQSVEQLKQSLVSCISSYYNPPRPHSHDHGTSPNQGESIFFQYFACPLY